ncbi:unnamed protein product [Prunus brigantina]
MKEDRLSPNYSASITSNKLDGSNYASWSPGLDLQCNGVRSRILALSPIPPPLKAYVMVMEEDTCQSAKPNEVQWL